MNGIKIILLIVVIGTLGAAIYMWTVQSPPQVEGPVSSPISPKHDSLMTEIMNLQNKPPAGFQSLQSRYRSIDLSITKFGGSLEFSSDTIHNTKLQKGLEANLFASYSDLFCNACMNYFQQSSWSTDTLRFIQKEADEILNSPNFDSMSNVEARLDVVKDVLDKYWEIRLFIETCRSFQPVDRSLNMDFYTEVQPLLLRANTYLNNDMENPQVANCNALRNELQVLEQMFYRKHVDSLEALIRNQGRLYRNYLDQPTFQRQVISRLYTLVDNFDPQWYGISKDEWRNDDYGELKNVIRAYVKDACVHFKC